MFKLFCTWGNVSCWSVFRLWVIMSGNVGSFFQAKKSEGSVSYLEMLDSVRDYVL